MTTVEVEQAVHQLEQQARTVALALVKHELDQLVRDRALSGGNGTDLLDPVEAASATNGPTTKTCTTCGQEKRGNAFEKGRNVCRQCRRTRASNGKAEAAEAVVDHPPPEPSPV